jgi:hypothetical protein
MPSIVLSLTQFFALFPTKCVGLTVATLQTVMFCPLRCYRRSEWFFSILMDYFFTIPTASLLFASGGDVC